MKIEENVPNTMPIKIGKAKFSMTLPPNQYSAHKDNRVVLEVKMVRDKVSLVA